MRDVQSPDGYPGRHPGPKTIPPSLGAQEDILLRGRPRPEGTDVHDPRGSQKNFMAVYARELRGEFFVHCMESSPRLI